MHSGGFEQAFVDLLIAGTRLTYYSTETPEKEVVVCRSEFSEVLRAESPRSHTRTARVSTTSVFSRRTFNVNGASSISYSSRLNRS